MLAYCGLKCLECPVFRATKTNDEKLRIETAKNWSEYFEKGVKPEELYCDGCQTLNRRIFSWCKKCPVRLCAGRRRIQNCGFCDAYPCKDIMEIHKINPQAKQEIENIFKEEKRTGGLKH
ncbi:MAG: DUF3795 domain-containing protein [Thermodesulfobacteriota bacterium]|nr:DUF3795 domain-containing protein [Thermodesulfobacteriota bacterium]